uniref:Orn/DAP/Arg decarboxylase 2 N-terminal domain-containing protein n=1 Tax=Mucochytrium quahogii TaxID=96639 RepID=A0A7S2SMX0_9STRA|eukprot:CAMPEP_0203793422 /NCGR_PEP_ID=MMETSP0100_2-20121128/5855_1 /ASSEMBLY_ACC=CAM_ASM_000210 /TAXON_ID=96639 /ORGANISM=" , Strain NY0313808BC1" /LENGTH=458 /DNA_ID=CAMNT_0050697197 /DNA_START=89 /DNA_END=1465 /DNA_ORIENTATION=-
MTGRISLAVHAAAKNGLLGNGVDSGDCDVEDKPMAMFYDLDDWEDNLSLLRERTFKEKHFKHAVAVKSNPLEWFLKRAKQLGHGAECATISEVVHSLNVGFAPNDVVFDCPCKTIGEIKFALARGVHLNLDNVQELARVKKLFEGEHAQEYLNADGSPKSTIGIRINPLVGAGTILEFSVSTGKSKFGVPLESEGEGRATLVKTVSGIPWITCVHVHTGSGGMGLNQLVSGVRKAVDFALEINKRVGSRQIKVLDMGGGLAVDFDTEQPLSNFEAYCAELRKAVPEVFDVNVFDRVVSEFGASCNTKFGWLASRVEYTKSYDGGRIALIHAGSDIFLRACYAPEKYVRLKVYPFDSEGNRIVGKEGDLVPHDIAGPLCFAGDVVVSGAKLPELSVNDIVVVSDAGGNTLSLHNSHCSRQLPCVYGYKICKEKGSVTFVSIQQRQRIEDAISQWKCEGV